MREDQVFVWTTKKNVIYVVLACSKNYDRHLWFWLQWKAWERKKSVQSGWGTVKNKDRGGSGGVNILFAFPHPFPPWATLTPNQTWPFEEMITSISMLTPLNEMLALQLKDGFGNPHSLSLNCNQYSFSIFILLKKSLHAILFKSFCSLFNFEFLFKVK